ncbi:flavin reductase family protein [bacterium]
MRNYKEITLGEAYRLIGHGPVILVCSRSESGEYNIAPIAWNCPVKKDPFRIFMEIGMRHKTYSNILETKEFVVCVPLVGQIDLVKNTGTSKGAEKNKFEVFDITTKKSQNVDIKVPVDCIGYIECKLLKTMELDSAGLVIGEGIRAIVHEAAFADGRLLTEKKEGKTIHHLGGKVFTYPTNEVL